MTQGNTIGMAELTGIGGAVIGDLELEITDLDKEISYLTKELKKAERLAVQGQKYQQLWRAHLDDRYPQDDDEQEAEARQMDWNQSDTDSLAEYEGKDRDEVEATIPF